LEDCQKRDIALMEIYNKIGAKKWAAFC